MSINDWPKVDNLFKHSNSSRFRASKPRIVECSKLLSNGKVVSGTEEVQSCRKAHFSALGKSYRDSNSNVMNACFNIASLDALTRQNDELIADTEITVDEVNYVLKLMKNDRSTEHDDLDSNTPVKCAKLCLNRCLTLFRGCTSMLQAWSYYPNVQRKWQIPLTV